MTEEIIVESTEPEDTTVYTEVVQTNGQLPTKAYNYRVKIDEKNQFNITVITTSGTAAREGLAKQLPPTASVTFLNVCEQIVQFQ